MVLLPVLGLLCPRGIGQSVDSPIWIQCPAGRCCHQLPRLLRRTRPDEHVAPLNRQLDAPKVAAISTTILTDSMLIARLHSSNIPDRFFGGSKPIEDQHWRPKSVPSAGPLSRRRI